MVCTMPLEYGRLAEPVGRAVPLHTGVWCVTWNVLYSVELRKIKVLVSVQMLVDVLQNEG